MLFERNDIEDPLVQTTSAHTYRIELLGLCTEAISIKL